MRSAVGLFAHEVCWSAWLCGSGGSTTCINNVDENMIQYQQATVFSTESEKRGECEEPCKWREGHFTWEGRRFLSSLVNLPLNFPHQLYYVAFKGTNGRGNDGERHFAGSCYVCKTAHLINFHICFIFQSCSVCKCYVIYCVTWESRVDLLKSEANKLNIGTLVQSPSPSLFLVSFSRPIGGKKIKSRLLRPVHQWETWGNEPEARRDTETIDTYPWAVVWLLALSSTLNLKMYNRF